MNTKTSHTLTQSWNSKKKKTKSKTRETCETLSIVVAYRFCTALIRAGEEEAEEEAEEGAERIARTSSGKFFELRIRSVCGGRREGFKLNFKCKIDAQVELELCLQGQHGSKCSSRLCHTHIEIGSCATHTHTNEVLPCVWHELQLPLFAFWLHCKYIFVCCLNSKSACYIYNWSICIYIFAHDKYAKFICLRVASVCCKCVSVCVCAYPVSWQPKIFLLVLPLLFFFPFLGVACCHTWAQSTFAQYLFALVGQTICCICCSDAPPSPLLKLRLISKHGGQ